MHWATDTGFKCLFCWKGEGREGWRSRVLSQGSPRLSPLPLPPNSKAPDYIGASDKHQQKGGKFWRFFCFQKSTHFPLLNDPYNNLNFLLWYFMEIVSMGKLNCAIQLTYVRLVFLSAWFPWKPELYLHVWFHPTPINWHSNMTPLKSH